MFSGNEWVILMVLAAILLAPAMVIALVVVARGRSASGPAGPSTPGGPAAQGGVPSGWPQGWYADPSGRHSQRYFDGSVWTDAVISEGQPGTDPL